MVSVRFFIVLVLHFSRHVERCQNGSDEAHASGRELDACGEVREKGDEEACGRRCSADDCDEKRVVVHPISMPVPLL